MLASPGFGGEDRLQAGMAGALRLTLQLELQARPEGEVFATADLEAALW